MSFLISKGPKVKPQFTGLQTQTSTSAVCVPLCYGENRLAPNIIYQGDFASHKQKQKAGKGGGGSTTTYTYSATFQLGLCWGPIQSVTRTWKDQEKKDSYTTYGFTLQVGNNPQAPWGYMTANHPSQALGYPDIAVLSVANYDLGQTNAFGQHSFQTQALLWNTGIGGTAVGDADPSEIIQDFLQDPTHGMGMSLSSFSNLLSTGAATTTGDSAYQTYCRAMGFALSPFLVSQEKASDILDRWLELTNTAPVSTGYTVKFHPYGPDTITANGVTYLPDFPVRYELTDSDFIYAEGEDPITFNRTDPADAANTMSLVIANKNNEFNDLTVPWKDQGLIDQFGKRPADNQDAKEVTDPAMAAVMVALMGQRKAYIRNGFNFKLGIKFCRIEPMDILGCNDPLFGHFYVLVKEVNEQDDNQLDITAEEYPSSISSAPINSTQTGSNTPVNTAVDPGPVNPPIIFEPPSSLSGAAQVWAAVSGGNGTIANSNWGGCYVWLSTDNIEFNQIGQIDTPARMGKLTALLATYGGSNPDTAHTLAVDLSMSNGDLSDAASPSDAAAGVTVSYIGGELSSYELATLSGPHTYNCTNLYRALYGTTVGAHAIGSNFARLDDSVFKFDLPAAYIGKTLYLKFQSYNIFAGAAQDLSTCTVYTYVPTGLGFGTGTSGIPSTPTGLSGSSGGGFAKLTWNANPANDNVTRYEVWRATGSSQPFGSASKIGSTTGLEYIDTSGASGQPYTYFLVAVNPQGSSTATAGINLTSTTATGTYRLYGSFSGLPDAAMEIFDIEMSGDESFISGFPSNLGSCDVAPTNSVTYPIKKNGTTVGSMNIASGATVATWTLASNLTFSNGDRFAFYAPTTQDPTLSGTSFTFIGKRG